jgi:hypothetical protein
MRCLALAGVKLHHRDHPAIMEFHAANAGKSMQATAANAEYHRSLANIQYMLI